MKILTILVNWEVFGYTTQRSMPFAIRKSVCLFVCHTRRVISKWFKISKYAVHNTTEGVEAKFHNSKFNC